MTEYVHLWLYFLLVAGVIALPGVDMAFVMGSALSNGRRSGMAAIAGVTVGAGVHVLFATLGFSVLLRTVPGAAHGMLIAGGLYLSWIGYSLIRSRAITKLDTQVKLRSVSDTFRNGMVTSLLNPKAYLFTLAILPQFLRPEYGSMWIQATVLFSIIAVTQFVVYGVVALGADHVREWTVTRPRGGAIAARMVGVLLIAIALTTVLRGWNAV